VDRALGQNFEDAVTAAERKDETLPLLAAATQKLCRRLSEPTDRDGTTTFCCFYLLHSILRLVVFIICFIAASSISVDFNKGLHICFTDVISCQWSSG